MDAHHGHPDDHEHLGREHRARPERDERTEQLRAEIARLVADATDKSRSKTYRDCCARRIPHTQAILFSRIDRAAGPGVDPELSGSDATVEPAANTSTGGDMGSDSVEAGAGEDEGVE